MFLKLIFLKSLISNDFYYFKKLMFYNISIYLKLEFKIIKID